MPAVDVIVADATAAGEPFAAELVAAGEQPVAAVAAAVAPRTV